MAFIANAETDSQWQFRVYLNDKEIGFHNYKVSDIGGVKRVFTEADFRVRFLFFTAYEYRHINTEIWDGECLQAIDAWTDANGETFIVEGSRSSQSFELETADAEDKVKGCVKTFAYWNPSFLEADELLNSQTGELMPVTVEELGEQDLIVQGKATEAEAFRLLAPGIDLELWYDENRRWLGLESTTEDGHLIRYELVEGDRA